jgi:hypothetical protein
MKGELYIQYNSSGWLQYVTLNMDHPDQKKKKINKETSDLNYITSQMYLTDTEYSINRYRMYILFNSTWNFFQDKSYFRP